ncbi:pancreatic triacylglycerol lipase-like [Anoplophora glabripennis]|uniref:pancreatic triacylglycerol lipase-like n=1 Tax=Anoplophora glabripennis TaxID=217634 RepID=UPI0008739E4F|nr:pancreatic triacylglycerol lipase-like [Anoplophora glabripennis]
MNTVVVFSVLIAVVLSSSAPQNNNETDDVVDHILDAIDAVVGPELEVEESNIIYWFFSKENPSNGIPVNRESISHLHDTSFNTSRDTIFIVHGWRNTNSSAFITTVREAIVANLDVNIFVVDWSDIAAQSYIPARTSVPDVGKFLAHFIDTLVSDYNLSLSRTTLVGHSLGAQVVGIAGAALNGNVAVIVGLDPALPLFATSGVEDRLDPTDAKFVQVIHTNGGLKGFLSPIGDSDYYPNGGMRQPGCGLDIDGSCAHARAYEYYAESLEGSGFVGVSCGSYLRYSDGDCGSDNTSMLGTSEIDTSASGRYYLDTNSGSPYAQG